MADNFHSANGVSLTSYAAERRPGDATNPIACQITIGSSYVNLSPMQAFTLARVLLKWSARELHRRVSFRLHID